VPPTSGTQLEVQVVANDPVVEWHQIFNAATLATVPVPSSLTTSRSAALVSVSVFDAINGVDRWYAPYLVTRRAPARTSANAAAVQAAYAMLLKLYPAQATTLTTRREASIAALMGAMRGAARKTTTAKASAPPTKRGTDFHDVTPWVMAAPFHGARENDTGTPDSRGLRNDWNRWQKSL
jgi:hypothetical protein